MDVVMMLLIPAEIAENCYLTCGHNIIYGMTLSTE